MKEQPSLRFDHREIAVIFSLFVFVSLLMFTVGILVGKGLAQSRYEGMLIQNAQRNQSADTAAAPTMPAHEPSEITHPASAEPETTAPAVEAKAPAPQTEKTTAEANAPAANVAVAEAKSEAKKDEPLKLIPQRGRQPDLYGNSLQEAEGKSAENILKNPKLKSLFDESDPQPAPSQKRQTASVPKSGSLNKGKFPASLAQGKFTVQVGSYPTEKDASERVVALKQIGFPHAYFTAKELGEKKDTWYRVWLGYYTDLQSAQRSGEMLQEKGEVKNYLVRKTDSEN